MDRKSLMKPCLLKWNGTQRRMYRKFVKNVMFLTRGYSCAKSRCQTRVCKCKKANVLCGPGCSCRECQNTVTEPVDDETGDELGNEDSDSSSCSINSDVDSLIGEENYNLYNIEGDIVTEDSE